MFILKEAGELYDKFVSNVFKPDDVLDAKTKELVALAVSLSVDCIPCIKHHYKEAVKAGNSQQEIALCCAIVMSISAGSKRAKYSEIISKLEGEC